jgi:hypothetical protein
MLCLLVELAMHLILLSFVLAVLPILVRAEPVDPSPNVRSYPIQLLRKQCIELAKIKVGPKQGIAKCSVSQFSPLGTIGQWAYYYALYCFSDKQGVGDKKCDPYSPAGSYFGGMVIFSRDDGSENVKPIIEHVDPDLNGLAFYQTPEIVSNSIGTFLIIPLRAADTGAENLSNYYLWKDGRWQIIDTTGWLKALGKKITGKGMRPSEVVWPDLKTMTAEVALFRAEDPACCGSGGTVKVRLGLKDQRFQIDAITITDSTPTSPESSAESKDYHEPTVGSSERKAVLDAVRQLAEDRLKQPINFVVRALPVADDWVVALLEPVTKEGKPIDWAKTSMASKMQKLGLEWEPWVLALLKKEIGHWTVWEFTLGEIFQGLDQWPKRYPSAPEILFGIAGVATNCDPCE